MSWKTRILFLLLIFIALSANAQDDEKKESEFPKAIVINGDTVMVFSMEQAKSLAVKNERLKECDVDRELLNAQIDQMDTLNKQQESKIENLYLVIDEERTQNQAKDVKIELHESENEDLKDDVSKQKTQKWVAIGVGVVSIIIVAVLSN